MTTTPAIAWFDGERRFVGRYQVREGVLRLDGTTTAARRERASVDIPLASIRRVGVLNGHGSPAARVETGEGQFVIELVTGSKADARAFVDSLRA